MTASESEFFVPQLLQLSLVLSIIYTLYSSVFGKKVLFSQRFGISHRMTMIDKTVFKDKKAVYYTLGCKLNFSETSTIERQLQEAGIRTAKRGEVADICVVNSCAVTQEAEKKCRQVIHKLVRQHPGAFVVVTGCYAQLSAEKLAQEPGVGVVLGIDKKGQVLDYVVKKLETNA